MAAHLAALSCFEQHDESVAKRLLGWPTTASLKAPTQQTPTIDLSCSSQATTETSINYNQARRKCNPNRTTTLVLAAPGARGAHEWGQLSGVSLGPWLAHKTCRRRQPPGNGRLFSSKSVISVNCNSNNDNNQSNQLAAGQCLVANSRKQQLKGFKMFIEQKQASIFSCITNVCCNKISDTVPRWAQFGSGPAIVTYSLLVMLMLLVQPSASNQVQAQRQQRFSAPNGGWLANLGHLDQHHHNLQSHQPQATGEPAVDSQFGARPPLASPSGPGAANEDQDQDDEDQADDKQTGQGRPVEAFADPEQPANGFSSRQGQLAPPDEDASAASQRRPARQPQPQPQLQAQLQGRQQQLQAQQQARPRQPLGATQGAQMQPSLQFQRLRGDQLTGQFVARPPGQQQPQQQQPQLQQPQQQQPQLQQPQLQQPQLQQPQLRQQQPQLGPPTLSAFDLSSLANLASQPGGNTATGGQFAGAPSGQLQANFRRMPVQQPAGQQQQRPNALGAQQPGFAAGGGPFQLQPVGFVGATNGGQPTELPFIRQVFRPASLVQPVAANERPQASSSAAEPLQPASGRPTPPPLFVPGRQQLASLLASSPAAGSGRLESGFSPMQPRPEVFFEPSSGRAQQAGAAPRPQQGQLAPRARDPQQQQQPPQLQQQLPRPTAAANLNLAGPLPERRPPNRRPSQRPQVPAANQAARSQQQAAPEVIRLAANAIQAANEGLGLLANGPRPALGQGLETSPSGAAEAPRPAGAPTTTTTVGATDAPPTSTAASSPTRLAGPSQPAAASLAGGSPQPGAGQLAPRRRIPVRANVLQTQDSASRPQAQQQAAPVATTTGATPPAGTTAGSLQLAATTTTTSAPGPGSAGQRLATASGLSGASVRRPEMDEFYETIGNGFSTLNSIDRFSAPARQLGAGLGAATSSTSVPINVGAAASTTTTTASPAEPGPTNAAAALDLYGNRLSGNQDQLAAPQAEAEAGGQAANALALADDSAAPAGAANSGPVLVPVTYLTTLTYLTTVLHGTHTLETSHESLDSSTRLATLDARLMDQLERRLPLIEPTATIGLSSRTKGRGTTIINLKSAVAAYNQELVEALANGGGGAAAPASAAPSPIQATIGGTQAPASLPESQPAAPSSQPQLVQQVPIRRQRPKQTETEAAGGRLRTIEPAELVRQHRGTMLTEYVYSYTMRPLASDQPVAPQVLVRSELVQGAGLEPGELMVRLQELAALPGGANSALMVIDSNGLMRPTGAPGTQLNLGSTTGQGSPAMLTEVNLNLASYLSFDGITNALAVDIKPTRLASASDDSSNQSDANTRPLVATGAAQRPPGSLDTSFDVHLTLGNALDQLSQASSSGQQTPALDSQLGPTRATASNKLELDLLRSTPAAAQPSLARSQLRSRVASSRFRSQQQLQTLQPSRASGPISNVPSASVSSPVPQTPTQLQSDLVPAPISARIRPNKSRLARPQLQRNNQASNDGTQTSIGQPADTGAAPLLVNVSLATVGPLATSVRSTKPRFVVVTRTGQFGIRAPATVSSSSSQTSDASAFVEASSVFSQPILRISSRFSKPNRFRGPSQAIQVTRVPAAEIQAISSTIFQPATTTTTTTIAPPTDRVASSTRPLTTTTDQANGQQAGAASNPMATGASGASSNEAPLSADPATGSSLASSSLASGESSSAPMPSTPSNELLADGGQAAAKQQQQPTTSPPLDPLATASVVVTYFTTTTHTIPFTLNSETVFTTLEETNSRIATEFVRDLGAPFIEPTPSISPDAFNQLATATTMDPNSGSTPATGEFGRPNSGLASSGLSGDQAQANSDQATSPSTAPLGIEPSFVVSLNTRTYFTTFTYFTTYSAGNMPQSIKSSESTTSNIITETITSTLGAADGGPQSISPTAIIESSVSGSIPATLQPTTSTMAPATDSGVDQQSSTSPSVVTPPNEPVVDTTGGPSSQPDLNLQPTTRTLLSTTTYYEAVYNGTQTSLAPIVDVNTQLVTLNAQQQQSAGVNLNSGVLGVAQHSTLATIEPSSVPKIQQPATSQTIDLTQPSTGADQSSATTEAASPTPPLDGALLADRITRTRSVYTTLTHFITFYSGTKTQLSTIQEISPTVVTEFIDRTQFERQKQQSADLASSSSVLLLVPAYSASEPAQVGSSPSDQLVQPTATLMPGDSFATTTVGDNDQQGSSTSSSKVNEDEATNAGGSTLASTSSDSSVANESTVSSGSTSSTTTSSTTTTTAAIVTTMNQQQTTQAPAQAELDSIQVNQPERPQVENQQQELRASGGASDSSRDRQTVPATNIIELSDLIAANSSQSSRVALAGNLGAAIKDIVQLLAGNKTTTSLELPGVTNPAVFVPTGEQASGTAQTMPATTTTTGVGSLQATTSANGITTPPRPRNPTRVFGHKPREHQLQGSISSPTTTGTSKSPELMASSGSQQPIESSSATTNSGHPTPELQASSSSLPALGASNGQLRFNQQQPAAATIFFGDDGGDERRKQVKTVWPGAQSTLFVTSVEPSARSLIVTSTKVYYSRDSPITITSSLTSVIAPRTFVSTIMGTRTLVNQLGSSPSSVPSVSPTPLASQGVGSTSSVRHPSGLQASRQDSQAASNRFAVQQKQQKQQQQVEREHAKQQQQQQQQQQLKVAASKALGANQQIANGSNGRQPTSDLATNTKPAASVAQCQPACRPSLNEVCKFTPASEGPTSKGSFACACRPGYYLMLNQVGQRQCQEVQSYVILLRLLQIGDQQVAYRRELAQKSSPEFKQVARIVREHVKRAYMTSELTRDRFVGVDIINFARPSSVASAAAAFISSTTTAAQISGANNNNNNNQLEPALQASGTTATTLNSGLIVNMTIHLQLPTGSSNEIQLDELLLKEELTKKLNMRQAAALAAAAAANGDNNNLQGQSSSVNETLASTTMGMQQGTSANNSNLTGAMDPTTAELLPNPNALFLADVEQVHDLDECANPALNDCHEGATCINEPGSYRCDCREYPDLNPLKPGRQCANELKSCDYCNNRGDCLRVPNLSYQPLGVASNSTSSSAPKSTSSHQSPFSTICQCHRIYLGRRCEINGLLLATLLPIAAILLIILVCSVIYCCRRYRKRAAMHKGFRNIGSFGPNMIGGTLDRKAMLESSSESSDTHQRSHHHHHLRAAANGIYETHGAGLVSDPSSSNESSPRQMVRNQLVDGSAYHLGSPASQAQQPGAPLNPYCNSIPPQIVIPRARHNQVNYAVHRGQVYMW